MDLRWYQSEAVDATWRWLCSNAGNPVIVLPTGAGKSLVIAQLCRDAIERYNGRVLVLAHRKELLVQNAEKIRRIAPDLDVGVYSAGLDSRDTEHGVVCAGVQSVFRRAEEFGQRNLVLIDESHLVQHDGEGMYRTLLDGLRTQNPRLRCVGLTATPYRLDVGPICRPDGIFQKVAYSAPIRQLIDEGWLCNLTTRPAAATVDTSGLKIRAGEFIPSQAESLFESVVGPACREIVAKTAGRKSILVFCSGVHHAAQVAAELLRLTGEQVGIVTGDSLPIERAQLLGDFKSGRLRWLCNVDVLTTGFDAPNIDAIGILRATMSPGLFAQIVGRGFRVHESKQDCLVLDFGGNIKRHGPIDAPDYGVQDRRQKHAGEAPVKRCPNCEAECLLQASECPDCGFAFPRERELNHDTRAAQDKILSEPERWTVDDCTVSRHVKRNAEPGDYPTLRVNYECHREGSNGNLASETISEWVCIEHPQGFAQRKAKQWWARRSRIEFPASVYEAVDIFERGGVACPSSITAAKQGKFWRVLSYEILGELPDRIDDVDEPVDETSDAFAEEEIPF